MCVGEVVGISFPHNALPVEVKKEVEVERDLREGPRSF
jgi:hypothetical protein